MRLRVPRGYGVAIGQRYEVCPHLPGEHPLPECGLIGSAWVTVARVQSESESGGPYVEVELARNPIEADAPPQAE